MLVIDGTHFCKFWQKHNQQVNQDKQTAPAKKKNFYFTSLAGFLNILVNKTHNVFHTFSKQLF